MPFYVYMALIALTRLWEKRKEKSFENINELNTFLRRISVFLEDLRSF